MAEARLRPVAKASRPKAADRGMGKRTKPDPVTPVGQVQLEAVGKKDAQPAAPPSTPDSSDQGGGKGKKAKTSSPSSTAVIPAAANNPAASTTPAAAAAPPAPPAPPPPPPPPGRASSTLISTTSSTTSTTTVASTSSTATNLQPVNPVTVSSSAAAPTGTPPAPNTTTTSSTTSSTSTTSVQTLPTLTATSLTTTLSLTADSSTQGTQLSTTTAALGGAAQSQTADSGRPTNTDVFPTGTPQNVYSAMSPGKTAGIAIGSVGAFALITGIIFLLFRRRDRRLPTFEIIPSVNGSTTTLPRGGASGDPVSAAERGTVTTIISRGGGGDAHESDPKWRWSNSQTSVRLPPADAEKSSGSSSSDYTSAWRRSIGRLRWFGPGPLTLNPVPEEDENAARTPSPRTHHDPRTPVKSITSMFFARFSRTGSGLFKRDSGGTFSTATATTPGLPREKEGGTVVTVASGTRKPREENSSRGRDSRGTALSAPRSSVVSEISSTLSPSVTTFGDAFAVPVTSLQGPARRPSEVTVTAGKALQTARAAEIVSPTSSSGRSITEGTRRSSGSRASGGVDNSGVDQNAATDASRAPPSRHSLARSEVSSLSSEGDGDAVGFNDIPSTLA